MSVKLGRNYVLTITTVAGQQLTIKSPITLELDITRKTLGSVNVAQFRLYNLSAYNRNLIRFNAFDGSDYNFISLDAGYGTVLSNVFNGNIMRAWSIREGSNFITQIESYDGGFAYVNGETNSNFPAGTPLVTVYQSLMSQLPHVTLGAVGNFPGVLTQSRTYSGNIAQILTEESGGAFFIDAGKSYLLHNNEYIASVPAILIDASTGLLNTPVLEETYTRFEMIFEPSLNIGSLAVVNSTTLPLINGTYSITGVKHRGIISEVVSGDLITTGEFLYSKVLTPVVGLNV